MALIVMMQMLLWMFWEQFYAWGELNELINKCSTFVLFDLIRKCGRQRCDYRESNTTTETTRAIEARATIVAQSNKQQAHFHNKVWNLKGKMAVIPKVIKSALNNHVNKVPY